jgi:hypothetical protein
LGLSRGGQQKDSKNSGKQNFFHISPLLSEGRNKSSALAFDFDSISFGCPLKRGCR